MSYDSAVSVVKFYDENRGYRCGYCKSPNTNYSHGMWAYDLSVQDYQDMIDRGWRRSGRYCYKPTLHLTCCPMYTIKCSVLDFKLSRSQKKKIKRLNNFLAHGRSKAELADDKNDSSMSNMESGDDDNMDTGLADFPNFKERSERAQSHAGEAVVNTLEQPFKDRVSDEGENISKSAESMKSDSSVLSKPAVSGPSLSTMNAVATEKKTTRPGDGIDPNKPQCKKAKLMRLEKKQKKMSKKNTTEDYEQKVAPPLKSVDDFINEALPDNPTHRLQIKLVRSNPESKEFLSTLGSALEVYQRYQMTIHNDPKEKLTERQFRRFLIDSPLQIKLVSVNSLQDTELMRTSWLLFSKYQMSVHNEPPHECDISTFISFLVDSPLEPYKPKDGPPQGYGSFHQQYYLDDRLIAVGVIDILPSCVSSVYFFYDPDFHFLVLGTYGSLREISFCRSLNQMAPSLKYYYMGFYIHSCPKMRYKGAYCPSFLLCPETYTWHPIESCIPLLEKNKYSRLNENPDAKDCDEVTSLHNVRVLFHNKGMSYKRFLSHGPHDDNLDEVTQYAKLVGNKLSQTMLLIVN